MKSFVVNMVDLFQLNSNKDPVANFDPQKRKLTIPKYQREYKWKNEKIISMLNDIKKNSKFLGNIILDQTQTGYEIVDGQQRITTCMLIFLAMYNYYDGHLREQESWRSVVKPYGDFLFSNETIGNFIVEVEDRFNIVINAEDDIYNQKNDFLRAFDLIENFVGTFQNNAEATDFKQKLFDCDFLVLINDVHVHARPVEQLFLDINEKAQKLEVEDVFKGHCFENFENAYHGDLKAKWVDFKKIAMQYKCMGFDDVSEYIYLYLLEMVNGNLSKDLTDGGKHFLEGKTMDETESLLDGMIQYGQVGLEFCNNINLDDYRFVNLCADSRSHANTSDHIALKKMSKEMLMGAGNAIYQKLPLLTFLFYLSTNPDLIQSISHDYYRRITTNLYVYMKLFVISGQRKSKSIIDQSVRIAMESDNPIQNVHSAAKELRTEKVNNFEMQQTYKGEKLLFLYSVIDNYNSLHNWLPMIYGIENNHNIEHFIIHDNKKVMWEDGEITLILDRFSETFIKSNIKKATNYLVIDKNLNEAMQSKDIITKIGMIKDWYKEGLIPKHVSIFIDYIESMPEYIELKSLKGTHPTIDTIKQKYLAFWSAYFDENRLELLNQIKTAFCNAFTN